MKTNKIKDLTKIALILAGLVFLTSGLMAQSQSYPTPDGEPILKNTNPQEDSNPVDPEDLKSSDPYIYPDGYVEPTTPSVGVVIDVENMPIKNTSILPESRDPMPKLVVPDNEEPNMYPRYEMYNFTRMTAPDGSEVTFKVVTPEGQMLDSKPLPVETGNPEKDKADYEEALDQWLDENDPQ